MDDELLADLDDLRSDDEEDVEGELAAIEEGDEGMSNDEDGDGDLDGRLEAPAVNDTSVREVTGLRKTEHFKHHMNAVQEALASKRETPILGFVEDDPQYKLIVNTNKLLVKVADEIYNVYKFVSDIYKKKFLDLDALVPMPVDYVKVVQRIGNSTDMTLVKLDDILPSSAVMTVTMAGSATRSATLSDDDLNRALEGCEEVLALEADREAMLRFVSNSMHILAPNVTAITGPMIAAQLVGEAGGLQELARMPSCNIEVLGKEKKSLAGYGRSSGLVHAGFIYQCNLVQMTPAVLRKKANRLASNKIKLAASVDVSGGSPSGSYGSDMAKAIEKQLEKLAAPSKGKTKKALPVPVEKSRKRRGGKRARKQKEMFAQTELRKQLNRTSFASANEVGYADDAMGVDFGMLGKDGSGQLRMVTAERTKLLGVKSKKMAKRQYGGATSTINGLQTSLAFTPVQGFELMNPDGAAARVKAANDRYFASTSGFRSVKPRT